MTSVPAIAQTEQQRRTAMVGQLATQRALLRRYLQLAAQKQIITPEVVTAYAALHLTRDDGRPIVPADHHRLWLSLLCNEEIRKLLIIAPPESAKTTWTIMGYVGTYMSIHPQRSVIIGSASGPTAEKRSLALRNMVLSPNWQTTFPGLYRARGMPWKTNEWSIAPEGIPNPGRLHPTIAAYGTGGAVIGARADLDVADDLLDYENSRTSYQREMVETWFHKSFLSRRKAETGRVVVIGTAWHHDDLYEHLKKEGGWVVVHVPTLADSDTFKATITYPDNYTGPTLGTPVGATDLGDLIAERDR